MPTLVWSTYEAARELRVTDTHLRTMIAKGSITPDFITEKGRTLFVPDKIRAIARERKAR